MLNISAYKFVPLDRLADRKVRLKAMADERGLLGTILLSNEGINMFLSGEAQDVYGFFDVLRREKEFSDITPKESHSPQRPFRRMLVRIKKEIIAFGIPSVDPQKKTSPKLPAVELKRWLDEGRKVRLLDTRNDYEIELGTFHDAEHLNIHHFREFPKAIECLPDEAKDETIVMFCTGGIRCEKAGPLMEQAGFKHVYQLDGGILKYFEEVGGDHWDGACFVFDGRVALNPDLKPTGDQLCFACQAVLRPSDLASPKYKMGEYCPHCFKTPEVRGALRGRERQARVLDIARQQPGSFPYENVRNIYVAQKWAGLRLIDFLAEYQPNIALENWHAWIDRGEITFEGNPVTADTLVREGQHFVQREPGTIEPKVNPNIELLFEDDSLIVVNKPAPMPSHPSGRYHRNTLSWILSQAYPKQKLRVAHRIDANTSGVSVLCRTLAAARFVQPQFAERSVSKLYIARVHAHPEWDKITCEVPVHYESAERGSRVVPEGEGGLPCTTHFEVRRRCDDGTALVSANPVTGRTHQIRVHLWHLGHAIVNDPLYLVNARIGSNRTLGADEPPMNLHGLSITLQHPDTRAVQTFTATAPRWAAFE